MITLFQHSSDREKLSRFMNLMEEEEEGIEINS
jgi:hypothetical protein